jgi:PAS domain S-box-containing protein
VRTRDARWEGLLRHAFDVVVVTDSGGEVQDVVCGGSAFNHPADTVLGRSGRDFVHNDDLGTVTATWYRALREPGPQPPVTFRLRLADGVWGWAEMVISNALSDPAIEGMILNLRDVSLLRKAGDALAEVEQRYQRFIQEAQDAVAVLDSHGRVTTCNPRLATLLGRDPDELVGALFSDLGLPDPPDVAEPAPHRYERADGTTAWVQACTTPLRWPEDAGRGQDRLIWIQDVTQRVLLQDRLVEAARMEAIGRFAAGVVHDFNTVLTAIRLNAELLAPSVPPGSPAHHEVEGITRGVDRAAALVGQLLAFSRGQVLEARTVTVNEVLVTAVEFCRSLMPGWIDLQLWTTDASTTVHVDPGQLSRAVVNLVLNARDSIQGEGRVRVASRLSVAPGERGVEQVTFEVTDDGSGMSSEVAARCVEPFFTTKAAGVGTGLGLSTAHGFIVQSGGTLEIDSSPGSGTCVTVSFPRLARPASEEPLRRAGAEGLCA